MALVTAQDHTQTQNQTHGIDSNKDTTAFYTSTDTETREMSCAIQQVKPIPYKQTNIITKNNTRDSDSTDYNHSQPEEINKFQSESVYGNIKKNVKKLKKEAKVHHVTKNDSTEDVETKQNLEVNVTKETNLNLPIPKKHDKTRTILVSSDQEVVFVPGIQENESDDESIRVDYISSESEYSEDDMFAEELASEKKNT
jgi:hypothetical protein